MEMASISICVCIFMIHVNVHICSIWKERTEAETHWILALPRPGVAGEAVLLSVLLQSDPPVVGPCCNQRSCDSVPESLAANKHNAESEWLMHPVNLAASR